MYKKAYKRVILVCCIISSVMLGAYPVASMAQQNQPSLQIVSPASGTTVAPGDTITIDVEATPDTVFPQGVGIFSKDIVGLITNGPPYRFSINIPHDAGIGRRKVYAEGKLAPGNFVKSNTIILSIEMSTPPDPLRVEPGKLLFSRGVGRNFPLAVYGTFPDGTTRTLTNSSLTHYQSDNPNVVTVNDRGTVTTIGVGKATIKVTYGNNNPIDVPVTVEAPSIPPPVANAGTTQTVRAGTTVTLDGSKSSEPNGQALAFHWTQTGGPAIKLSNPYNANPKPTFTAPDVSTDTTLTFQLIVNNGISNSAPAFVIVNVIPKPTGDLNGDDARQSKRGTHSR